MTFEPRMCENIEINSKSTTNALNISDLHLET